MDFDQDMNDDMDEYYADAAVELRVPKKNRALFIELIELIDSFCEEYLDEDYYDICEEVAGALCRSSLEMTKIKQEVWASGIVHAVGWVNYLSDPASEPHMEVRNIAKAFGVSQSNMTAKSKIIRDKLDMIQLDPRWCLPDLIDDNPLVWMFEVNGIIVDLRTAPREIQEKAYEAGIIPYIPADQWGEDWDDQDELEEQQEPDKGPKIIEFPSGKNSGPETKSADKSHNDGPNLFDGLER